MTLVPNPRGDYSFLPGGEPYSSGVVAADGFEVVHVTLHESVAYRRGFDRIDAHLGEAGRPRAALCGMELRSPRPFTRSGFLEFNRGYRALLQSWDLLVEGQNPIARTNVAPSREAPTEPALYGFSYTRPAGQGVPPRTFVVAGGGELRGGPIESAAVIRPGETTSEAMLEKASYVLRAMEKRLEGLGVGWGEVTATEVYTAQPLEAGLSALILEGIGPAARHGIRWHHSRPPIDELEFEMDLRGVRNELVI